MRHRPNPCKQDRRKNRSLESQVGVVQLSCLLYLVLCVVLRFGMLCVFGVFCWHCANEWIFRKKCISDSCFILVTSSTCENLDENLTRLLSYWKRALILPFAWLYPFITMMTSRCTGFSSRQDVHYTCQSSLCTQLVIIRGWFVSQCIFQFQEMQMVDSLTPLSLTRWVALFLGAALGFLKANVLTRA